MSLVTPTPASERPPRPVLVWVIAVVVLAATAFSLFSIAMVPALLDSAGTSDARREFLESQTTLNYAIAIAVILGNVTGAVLLFFLRRPALYVFIGALVLSLAEKAYSILVNDWLAAVGTSGLVVALAGWAVNLAIILYTWSLFRRHVLR
jgi:hypothetical protein